MHKEGHIKRNKYKKNQAVMWYMKNEREREREREGRKQQAVSGPVFVW